MKSVNQILGTLELPKPGQATATLPALNSKDKEWCRKWLKLDTQKVPELEHLEREVFRFCVGYRKHPAVGRLLVLYGNNGVGKSMCAQGVRDWAFRVASSLPRVVEGDSNLKYPDVYFAHWPKFLDDLKNGDWSKVDHAMKVSLLILDEIGAAHDPSRMGLDKLCTIMSHREEKWTIVTTNLTPDAWEEAFDRRVASRFFRNATHVEMNGVQDYWASK